MIVASAVVPGPASVVVDASALAAVLFAEPAGALMQEKLRDTRLIAPALLPFELASIYAKKCRRYPKDVSLLQRQWQWLRALALDLHGVDFDAVVRLALQHRLTPYDASYLWLALDQNLPLATLDTQLEAAWKSIA